VNLAVRGRCAHCHRDRTAKPKCLLVKRRHDDHRIRRQTFDDLPKTVLGLKVGKDCGPGGLEPAAMLREFFEQSFKTVNTPWGF
jgi:hypothetical protein